MVTAAPPHFRPVFRPVLWQSPPPCVRPQPQPLYKCGPGPEAEVRGGRGPPSRPQDPCVIGGELEGSGLRSLPAPQVMRIGSFEAARRPQTRPQSTQIKSADLLSQGPAGSRNRAPIFRLWGEQAPHLLRVVGQKEQGDGEAAAGRADIFPSKREAQGVWAHAPPHPHTCVNTSLFSK